MSYFIVELLPGVIAASLACRAMGQLGREAGNSLMLNYRFRQPDLR